MVDDVDKIPDSVVDDADAIDRDVAMMDKADVTVDDDKVIDVDKDDKLLADFQAGKDKKEEDEKDKDKKVDEPPKPEDEDKEKKVDEPAKADEKIDKIIKARPSIGAIKQKYPEIFKEFPELREALYRETELTQVFPTVDQAVEALEKSESFEQLEDDLSGGNFENLLDTVSEISKDSFKDLAVTFLPHIAKKDKDLYVELTSPILDRFLKALYRYGTDRNDENVKHAALHAALFAFNDEDYATGKKEIPFVKKEAKTPRELELEKREKEFLDTRHEEASDRVDTNIKRVLISKIEENLDPQKALSDFARSKVVEETLKLVDEALVNDERHMRLVRSLWKGARKASFSPEATKRITTAYLSRALQLVPATRSKVLTKAIGKPASLANDKPSVRIVPSTTDKGKAPQQVVSKAPLDPKTIDRRKTDDLDILEGRFTLKR
jgi:hypothetical protein